MLESAVVNGQDKKIDKTREKKIEVQVAVGRQPAKMFWGFQSGLPLSEFIEITSSPHWYPSLLDGATCILGILLQLLLLWVLLSGRPCLGNGAVGLAAFNFYGLFMCLAFNHKRFAC